MEKRTPKDKKIVRVENDTTILNINVEIFRSYFNGIVDGLKIKRCKISKRTQWLDSKWYQNFEKHPSIVKIKQINSGCRFSSENVSLEDVKSNSNTGYFASFLLLNIPAKIIKQNLDIFSEFFFVNIKAAVLFKYVWTFCYHQAFKGLSSETFKLISFAFSFSLKFRKLLR